MFAYPPGGGREETGLGSGSMEQPGTITRIIRELEDADALQRDAAVRERWERFFADLTTYRGVDCER